MDTCEQNLLRKRMFTFEESLYQTGSIIHPDTMRAMQRATRVKDRLFSTYGRDETVALIRTIEHEISLMHMERRYHGEAKRSRVPRDVHADREQQANSRRRNRKVRRTVRRTCRQFYH